MMIDSHCHIDMYPNPSTILEECEKKGIITISMTNLPSHFNLGRNYFLNKKKVRIALGMHPLYYENFQSEFPDFINSLDKTSYIGEIGLDFSTEAKVSKLNQLEYFDKIVGSISDKKKILSLHSRKAEKEVLDSLVIHKIGIAIFHWYSGPIKILEKIISEGYMLSINYGMINSSNGKKIIDAIPKNQILSESDGPFIKIKNQICYPWDVLYTYEYLSKKWEMPLQEVKKLVKNNFFNLVNKLN